MPVVRDLSAADDKTDEFEKAGYEWLGEFGINGRRYLRKGGDERTHQIHIFSSDDYGNIIRHLAFRSYLMRHERVREEYASLKRQLAARFPYDIESYSDGKDEFVKRAEAEALKEYDSTWDRMYIEARKHLNPRHLSSFVEAGSVAASLLTASGRIFTGVCFDTACSLGMCAERNAIGSMITEGESRIVRLAVVMEDGSLGLPCGACQELFMQLDAAAGSIEVLLDYGSRRTASLDSLKGKWWGESN